MIVTGRIEPVRWSVSVPKSLLAQSAVAMARDGYHQKQRSLWLSEGLALLFNNDPGLVLCGSAGGEALSRIHVLVPPPLLQATLAWMQSIGTLDFAGRPPCSHLIHAALRTRVIEPHTEQQTVSAVTQFCAHFNL